MTPRVGAALSVRLFGHVALELGGTPFALASQRSTTPLLAYLLLHREGPVARDALAYLLSPDDTEESARLRLRNNLYRLTRALPPGQPDWLLADVDSVRWNPDAEVRLDIEEFERTSRDPERLDEAVALYRGDLLATFYDEWVLQPRERYRNVYLASLYELVSRHRRARDLPRALGYAQQLLASDPFREDVLRRLIAIRHEAGDRAGALWEYQRFAQRLHEELGIEPMPETVALRDAIARDEPVAGDTHGTSPADPARAQTRELPFVGRQPELDQLSDAWSRATRQRGGCILIGGESGIGKSRLALEFARMAEDQGGRVLTGTTGSPEAIPYQAFIEALRSALPLVASLRIGEVWLAALATLLPELRERIPTLPMLPRVEPADERARLFEALARCFSALAKPRPLVVVLEDVHWAAESTLGALEYLLRRVSQLPVLLISTYRAEDMPRAHPLRGLRRRAHAEGLVRGLTLAPLTRADVAQLARRSPAIEAKLAALHAASDGNPLFLTQLIDVPQDELIASGAGGLRHLVAGRIEQRSSEARTIAEIAALMGTHFSRDAVVEVSGWQESAVLEALDELIDHRIVHEASGRGFFDYAFSHRIVAEVLAEAAPPDRAAKRHRRIARVLDELGGDRSGELSATVARQYDLAGDATAAAPRYLAAAERALMVGAVEEAESLASRGLALADEVPLRFGLLLVLETVAGRQAADERRASLLARLDAAASALDDDERRSTALVRRIAFAQERGDREREQAAIDALRVLVEGAPKPWWIGQLRTAQGRYAIEVGQLDVAQSAAEAALDAYLAAGDVRGEAESRTQSAEIATLRGDLGSAEPLVDAARGAAERADDASLTLRLMRMWFQYAFARRDLPRCLYAARSYLDTAIASGDRRAEADGHDRMGMALISCGGRYADAHGHFDSAATIFTELGDRTELANMLSHQGQLAEALGDFEAARRAHQGFYDAFASGDEPRRHIVATINLSGVLAFGDEPHLARDLAQRGLELARKTGYAVLEASAMENLAAAEAASGDHAAAIDHMERALAQRSETRSGGWTGVARANLALWYAIVGDTAQARDCVARMFEAEAEIGSATPWPQTCYWAAAQVLHACGDAEGAASALEQARRHLDAQLERVDEPQRATYLAIKWHRDILAATARGVWPDPPR